MARASRGVSIRHVGALHCVGKSQLFQEVQNDIEKDVFREVVSRGSVSGGKFFEWGLGGSTNVAAPHFGEGASADHVREWCDYLKTDQTIKCAIEHKSFEIMCFSLSAIAAKFGFLNAADTDKYRPYILAIQNFAQRKGLKTFDVVHVDGRFRVACALNAWKYMDDESVLLIHDYTNRPHYHVIEQVFEHRPEFVKSIGFNSTGAYGVFHRNPSVDEKQVNDILSKYWTVQE
eukprot:Lankesteria_metandrocarpae@DN2708_c0_g1_i1.p1